MLKKKVNTAQTWFNIFRKLAFNVYQISSLENFRFLFYKQYYEINYDSNM